MAGLRLHATSGPVALASTGSEAQLLLLAAPAAQKVKIEKIIVTLDSTTTTDPPSLLNIAKATGTPGGGASVTPAKLNQADAETPQTSVTSGSTGITGMTTGSIYEQDYINHNGSKQIVFPPGRELYVQGGDNLVVAITTGGTKTGTVHARVQIVYEE